MEELTLLIPDALRERAEEYRKAAESPSELVRNTLKLAEHHQQRLRMHTIPRIENCHDNTEAMDDFFAMVKAQISKDKFESFKSLLRYPLCSNSVLAKVWDKLGRVFDAKNKKFDYSFSDDANFADYSAYKEKIGLWEFFRCKLFQFAKTEINGIVVIDMPSSSASSEPYPYLVVSSKIKDFKADENGVFEYVTFQSGEKYVTIDDSAYYMYDCKDGNIGSLVGVSVHELGYVPACWIWPDTITATNPNLKLSPITAALELLDWYVFYVTASKSLLISGAYPIYSGYAANCNYNEADGTYCDHGILRNAGGEILYDSNSVTPKACPVCGTKRIAGPGAYVEIPVPDASTPDMRNPVQMLSVDKNALDFSMAKKSALETEIVGMCVGSDTEILTTEGINEKQVEATFESQTSVLLRLKKAFETIISFVENTICKLRYDDGFLGLKVDLGNEYFLQSLDSIRDEYSKAKSSGASFSELAYIQSRIYDKEFQGNDKARARQEMLSDLEPFKGLTVEELERLYGLGLVSKDDFLIKINFNEFISKFERINGKITNFGAQIKDYDSVIETIKEQLKQYANGSTTEDTVTAGQGAD